MRIRVILIGIAALLLAAVPAAGAARLTKAEALRITRQLAFERYMDSDNATGYGATCRRKSRVHFACSEVVSGVVQDRLVGEGQHYKCFYGVNVRLSGHTVTAKENGGVSSNNGFATC